jgi:peptidoglycan lytic transglycosylase G
MSGNARTRRRRPIVRDRRAGALTLLALVLIGGATWLALGHSAKSRPTTDSSAPQAIVRVLIPEGETRLGIAPRARAAGLTGSYLAASKRSALLDPTRYGAPAATPNLEGFLFPATYDLYRGESVARLVREQLIAFRERFGAQQVRSAHALHLTPYQLLIVASMVEREAALPGDRAKVAAVIYNRLRLGMPLGIDATIRYALNDFSRPLTAAQLALDSPYNTRSHRGLPPTPISNPGTASIEAAAHPAHVGYLYYVAAPDGCGEHVFTSSYAQFLRDDAAYQDALAANGGRVPTCHKR